MIITALFICVRFLENPTNKKNIFLQTGSQFFYHTNYKIYRIILFFRSADNFHFVSHIQNNVWSAAKLGSGGNEI